LVLVLVFGADASPGSWLTAEGDFDADHGFAFGGGLIGVGAADVRAALSSEHLVVNGGRSFHFLGWI
jgi:hypothetical protein